MHVKGYGLLIFSVLETASKTYLVVGFCRQLCTAKKVATFNIDFGIHDGNQTQQFASKSYNDNFVCKTIEKRRGKAWRQPDRMTLLHFKNSLALSCFMSLGIYLKPISSRKIHCSSLKRCIQSRDPNEVSNDLDPTEDF